MQNKRDGVATTVCNVVNLCVRNAWLFKFNVINLEIIKLAKLNIVISKRFLSSHFKAEFIFFSLASTATATPSTKKRQERKKEKKEHKTLRHTYTRVERLCVVSLECLFHYNCVLSISLGIFFPPHQLLFIPNGSVA